MIKPNAPSCERNQGVILEVLKTIIKSTDKNLLEIGSGTGQHAVFMASHFPELLWHTSDLLENHCGINQWIEDSHLKNIASPIIFESGLSGFPEMAVDVVYTANTLHIMSWENVQCLINQLCLNLKQGSQIVIYGPFNYSGKYTSESNVMFDVWLKEKQPHSGIRDFESIVSLMSIGGISLVQDIEMPSNNRILHFQKV